MNDQLALRNTSLETPPPYNQRSSSPLLLAETTTTRTEVVTTTTTETTAHFFSFPYFRKRPGSSHRSSKDDYSNHNVPSPRRPSDRALFEKALPPTPPDETRNSQKDSVIMHSPQDLVASSPIAQRTTEVVHFATSTPRTHSTAALTHAALGKGLPNASRSISYVETNTIPFVSSTSPIPVLTPTVRKSRSFQWLKRNVSENNAPSSNNDHLNYPVSERHRRLSFGANSPGDKGKPIELLSVDPKAAPKNISRRASFWSKKRGSPSKEPSNSSQDEGVILTMPPLPPVHNVSPFNISHLTEAPSSFPIQTTATTHASKMSLSCSEINEQTPLPSTGQSFSGSTPPQANSFSDPSYNVGPCETVAPLPRPRAQTNPPFLRRLSMVFSALEPSSPLDLHASNSSQLPVTTPTLARQAIPKPVIPKPVIPKPLSKEESPDIYLTRLQSAVSKAEIAGILASRYVVPIIYFCYIHFRAVQIHFMSRLFGHISINSTSLSSPLTLHCGNCSWKWAFLVKPNRLIESSRHLPSVIPNVIQVCFCRKVGIFNHPFFFIIQKLFPR